MTNPRDAAAALRRSAASASAAKSTPSPQSPDVDTDKKRRRRQPKSVSRLVLEAFGALAVSLFVLGRFFGVSIFGGAGDASDNTGSRELDLDTKGGDPVGEGTAASASSVSGTSPQQPPPLPSWVLSLPDAPSNYDGIPIWDARYGERLVTGRYAFRDSPGCASFLTYDDDSSADDDDDDDRGEEGEEAEDVEEEAAAPLEEKEEAKPDEKDDDRGGGGEEVAPPEEKGEAKLDDEDDDRGGGEEEAASPEEKEETKADDDDDDDADDDADDRGGEEPAPVACVAYYPEIDLSHHLDHDEALDAQLAGGMQDGAGANVVVGPDGSQTKWGPNGPVIGHSVTIPKGADDNVAVITRHGFRGAGAPGGKMNQDRAIVVSPFLLREGVSSPHDFVLGVFDGHGDRGHATAEWAMSEMPKALAKHLDKVDFTAKRFWDIPTRYAIVDAYHDLDHWAANVGGSGTTAASVLRLGKKLYVINVGDSRSFVATYVPSKAKTGIAFISVQHKPDMKEERQRIEALGGTVMLPPKLPPGSKVKVSSRVIAMMPNGMQLGLAMSRSIGDPEAEAFGVSSTPTIKVLDIDLIRRKAAMAAGKGVSAHDVQVFAVAASDGIYDHIEPEEVASYLSDSLYGGRVAGPSLLQACEQLVMKSSERWINMGLDMAYRDDISIAVSKVLI